MDKTIESLRHLMPPHDSPELSERAYRQAVCDCISVVSSFDELQWKDKSTAPKDGTLFLAWDNRLMRSKGLPRIGVWAKYLAEDRYCFLDFYVVYPIEFSHWMPLPHSPKQDEYI